MREPNADAGLSLGRHKLAQESVGRSRRPRRVASRAPISGRERLLIGTAAVVFGLIAWQALAGAGVIDPIVASSPSRVVQAAVALVEDGTLKPAVAQTSELFLVGFGISLVSGLIVGVLIGWYQRLDAALDPFISVLYAVPRIALVPLIMVWAGIGFRAQVVIVWTTAVLPIVVNTAVSISSVDRQLFTVARSFRATNWDVLRTIAIPGAVPGVIAGIRQGVALGLIGVVVAEYFIGNNGVGGLIVNAGQTLATAKAYVGVVIFAAVAILLNALLKAIERRLSGWRN